tara:strand:- start:8628 stop:9776 length:1149 start_codon:yes stop_codon:yes gene_type:complete
MNILNHQNNDPRENNFVLERKLVTIHSEDRDITKWPHANNFEVQLPAAYQNIHSMRLVDIIIPVNYYTFSNDNQNTKLTFKVDPKNNADAFYSNLLSVSNESFEIEIQEGFYEPNELSNEIKNKMNQKVTDNHKTNGGTETYNKFDVFYDKVAQKFWFGNTQDDFTLTFNEQISYVLSNGKQPNVWNHYTKWGLPSYIGFEKKAYTTSSDASGVDFSYMQEDSAWQWITPATAGLPVYYVKAPNTLNIMGEKIIYMEVEKYSSYDELEPYSEATTNLYRRKAPFQTGQNDFGTKVNSAFAKIPVTTIPHGETFESRNGFLQNVTIFDPPLERIHKLKFLFRYHDGRLVDFNDNPINFTLELHKLKNEMKHTSSVRVPPLYTL